MKCDIKCTLIWKNVEVKDEKDKEKLSLWDGDAGQEWSDFAEMLLDKKGLEPNDADSDFEIYFVNEEDD